MSAERLEGTLPGHGGWPVFYRAHLPKDARASVLLVHGYGEHSGKYLHVIEALERAGFAVLAPDHRGHGRTARVHGDIESRELVLSDLVVAHKRLTEIGPAPLFLLGHSLGGALALRYAERHAGRGSIAGIVLNGVALAVPDRIPPLMRRLAPLVARLAPTLALQSFFDPTRNTRDPEAQERLRTDPLGYRGKIRARTGVEVMSLIEETRRDLSLVEIPALLTHGALDRHVSVHVSEEIAARWGERAQLRIFPGLLHETWQEPERDEVIASWVDWIAGRLR